MMTEPQPDVHGVVEFYPEGLLHKFGLGDGDKLYDLVEEHDLEVDHRDLLIAVIERLVVPRLDQAVETHTLATFHNPIRAGTIDGEKADIYSTLTPEVIGVLVADIIAVASTLQRDHEAEEEMIAPPSLSDEKEAAPGIADAQGEETNAGQTVTDPLRAGAQGERVLRVFVSSTFRDMAAERDELVKRIFPQLRKLCDERGVTWGEVDLRWGITDEQSAEGKVLPVCLAEIARCRPYFIGLLGERYGWVPRDIPRELVEQESWLEAHRDQSVTEMEIRHGVLNNSDMTEHAFFYLRDPAWIETLPGDQRQDYRETSEEPAGKLDALKDRIRKSGFPVREDYPNPTALGQLVLEDLTALIDRLFPEGTAPDPLDREAADHEAFARSRKGGYVGRRGYFKRLSDHVDGEGAPLVVVGESGSGKSALLANWAIEWRASHPDDLVLMHFIGGTPHSSDWAGMLRRIMGELARRFEIDEEIPDQPDALRRSFANFLHRAAARGRVILILDALNQLEDREGALDLAWLPPVVPADVRMIVSSLPGRPLEELGKRRWPILEVELLEPDERREVIAAYLAQYTKQLSAEQVERIALAPQAANPLYLRALLEELRVFGVHEELDERIGHYLAADTVVDLYKRVLERYEEDYERDRPGLVGEAMSLIWAARRGLTESELLDLLGEDEKPLPHAMWSPLYLAAEQSLVNRAGLVGFFHDYLRRAVQDRYLSTGNGQKAEHLRLAGYFEGRDLGPRKVDELPWQLNQAEEWQRLHDLLADLPFFQASWEENSFEVKIHWAHIEAESPLRLVDAYAPVIGCPSEYSPFLWTLSSLLFDAGHPDPALVLRKHLVEHYRATGERSNLATVLGGQAWILQFRGDLDGAMALHKDAEQICREIDDKDGLSACLNRQGVILKLRGDLDGAMTLHKEAERLYRELGEKTGLQATLGNQGMILQIWGDLDGAMARHKEAEGICRERGDKDGWSACIGNQAKILSGRGDLDGAMALHKDAERLCRELGDKDGLQWTLGEQAVVLQHLGDLDGAMALLEGSETLCRELGNKGGLTVSLGNQAVILQHRGDLDGAMALHKEAERLCRELGHKGGLATSLGGQAWILQVQGDDDGAMALHKEEERLQRELGNPVGLAISLGNQAVLLAEGLHQPRRALQLVEEASDLVSRHELTSIAEGIRQIQDRVRSLCG